MDLDIEEPVNPFNPRGNLYKEAQALVSNSIITKDMVLIRDPSIKDNEMKSENAEVVKIIDRSALNGSGDAKYYEKIDSIKISDKRKICCSIQ